MDEESEFFSLQLKAWTKDLVDACTDMELLDLVYKLLLDE